MATVRKARHSERRFCFEVITPHLRRVYQATSDEEAQSWIGTINNSIKGVLSGTGSAVNLLELSNQIPVAPIMPRRHRRSISGAFRSGLAAVTGTTTSTSTSHIGSLNVVVSPSKSTPVKLKKGILSDETKTEMPLPPVPPPKASSALHLPLTGSSLSLSQTPVGSTISIPLSGGGVPKLPSARPTSSLFDHLDSSFSAPIQTDRNRWSGFSIGSFSFDRKDRDNGSVKSVPYSASHLNHFTPAVDLEVNVKLLPILKQDPSNLHCVDCNAKNPEWCSLNLGVLLCIGKKKKERSVIVFDIKLALSLLNIECSGIHRGLGTHVSKVRSLTMDTTSYTLDMIELLKSIGNARANDIWDVRISKKESRKDASISRPGPYESRTAKMAYIRAKYVNRQFVQEHDPQIDPNQLLFDAIDTDDIPKALSALASGADVNSMRPKQNKQAMMKERTTSLPKHQDADYMPQYALCCALFRSRLVAEDHELFPISQSSNAVSELELDGSSAESSISTTHSSLKRIFPMAELLLQHNADTSVIHADFVLDDQALAYINAKMTARGQSKIIRSSPTEKQHHVEEGAAAMFARVSHHSSTISVATQKH